MTSSTGQKAATGNFVPKMHRRLIESFDRFLFDSCDLRTCLILRVMYGLLVVVYSLPLIFDGPLWISDAGVMSQQTAQATGVEHAWSLFFWVPATPELVRIGAGLLLVHGVLLTLGFFSRIQLAAIFFWLVSIQHRNPLICDGEDTVFRVFAFLFLLLPLDEYASLAKRIRKGRWNVSPISAAPSPRAWALRLVQFQMAVIYAVTAWCKIQGTTWQNGTALFYVYQLEDLFGRLPIPDLFTTSEPVLRLTTWAVVAVESALPFALFYRRTRLVALIVGIGLHLSIEYAMHLFLFQWIMICGLLAFLPPKRAALSESAQDAH
ncbi:MAG: HTTM domain-containing protein [Planctomycetota bacterium]